MAYFLIIDESGQDRRESPCEVLAGVAVRDQDLWNLIQALRDAELRHFGVRYTADRGELKAKRLLKAKTFRLLPRCRRWIRRSDACLPRSAWPTAPARAGGS